MVEEGTFDDEYMRTTFSRGISGKWGYGDLLEKYSNQMELDNDGQLAELMATMLKFSFFQRFVTEQ